MLVFKVPTFLYVVYVIVGARNGEKSLFLIELLYSIDSNVKIENLLIFQNLGTRSFKKKETKRLPLIVIREVIAFHWFIYKNRKFLNFTIMKNFQRNLISKKNDIILITICEIITIY